MQSLSEYSSKIRYHQDVQNSHDAWDIVTHKTVPVMVFANVYNPRRATVQTPFVV
jgi:hypothetical protein